MPQLFHTDFCLSGQCVCRQYLEACLIARELSDGKDLREAKRRIVALLNEGGRLLDEQGIHSELKCVEE
jgi:hypothetical protein